LVFSYWFDKPWFITEGKLATVLIIPSSWGSQLGGYLPASPAGIGFSWWTASGRQGKASPLATLKVMFFIG
jgi:hypothetical protein